MVNERIWYKYIWRELKKQAKKIADSKADADSSSDESMSIKTPTRKRPSDSTRKKLEENFESEENLIFASSEGVKILSWDKVSYSKKVPATYALSNLSSPKQLKDTAADKRPFDLLGTKRPSDSTGNNLEKLFVSNEDLAFRSSKGVEVNNESQKRYVSHKFESSFQATMNQKFVYKYPPTPPVSSNASILNQNRNNEEIEVTSLQLELQEAKESVAYCNSLADIDLSDMTGEKSKEDRDATRLTPEETLSTLSDNWINVLPEEVRRKFINRSKSIHSEDSLGHFRLLVEILTTGTSEKIEDKPVENREDTRLMFEQILSMLSNDQDRDATLVTPEEIRSLLLDNLDCLDYVSLLPDIALSDKTRKKSKITVTSASRLYAFTQTPRTGVAEPNRLAHLKKLVDFATTSLKTIEKVVQNWEDTRLLYEQILSMLSNDQITVTSASRLYAFTQTLRTGVAAPNTGIEENKDTLGHEKDNVDQEKKNRGCYVSVVLNHERNSADVLFSCLLMKQDSLTYLKLAYESTTSPEKTGEELIEYINATAGFRYLFIDTLLNISLCQQYFLRPKDVNINGCKHELIVITLYRNNSNNEIRRVVRSTDMIDSKATHLFGPEKTKILFDLLVEKCVHFESTGTISGFVPNMAEYAVRQNVISLLVHAVDFLNILLIFFSSCPDINSLQKMTDKEIKSLMLQAIDYASLKGKSKKGAKPSLKVTKGIKYITVDSDEFLRAMGGEIPEDILYLHRHGEEMIVHRFDDTRHQPSNRNENRPIHSIYFPSDCRLFIYIPTENGSYWHQLDMQRASRIHDMSR